MLNNTDSEKRSMRNLNKCKSRNSIRFYLFSSWNKLMSVRLVTDKL